MNGRLSQSPNFPSQDSPVKVHLLGLTVVHCFAQNKIKTQVTPVVENT